MSIVSDILNLRQNQFSSVEMLIGMLDRQNAAPDLDHLVSRGFAVREAADLVLLNVAAHAAEALSAPPARRARRAVASG
jgi:hypothetical protein